MKSIQLLKLKSMRVIFVILLLFFVSVFIHESGHAITGKLAGVGNPVVHVWPGVEVYPNLATLPFAAHWPANRVASVSFARQKRTDVQFHPAADNQYSLPSPVFVSDSPTKNVIAPPVVGVMGSGLTYLLSVICLMSLWLFKPQGVFHTVLIAGSLLFYDLLFYAVFPTFFGLPHVVFFGGTVPEPVIYLAQMGVASWLSISVIIALSALHIAILVKLKTNSTT